MTGGRNKNKKKSTTRGSGSQPAPQPQPQPEPQPQLQPEPPDVVPAEAQAQVVLEDSSEMRWVQLEVRLRMLLRRGIESALPALDDLIEAEHRAPNNWLEGGRVEELYCIVYDSAGVSLAAVSHALKAMKEYKYDYTLPRCLNTFLVIGRHLRDDNDNYEGALSVCHFGLMKFKESSELEDLERSILVLIEKARIAQETQDSLLAEEEKEKAIAQKDADAEKQVDQGKGKDLEEKETDNTTRCVPELPPQVTEEPPQVKEEDVKLEATFQVVVDPETGRGSLSYGDISLSIRVLQIHCDEIIDFDDYRQLCSSHEGLLTVIHLMKHPTGHDVVVADDIYTFVEYLDMIMEQFSHEFDRSKSGWWRFIAERFICLFGEVVQTLLFLYGKGREAVGNLHMLCITKDGRTRIQPSMDKTRNLQDDAVRFLQLMKQMLFRPFGAQGSNLDEFDFPLELEHFLSFISDNKNLPAKYVLHHPFLWSNSLKSMYPKKLIKALHSIGSSLNALNFKIEATDRGLCNWNSRLPPGGIYHIIWQYGDPDNIIPDDLFSLIKSLPVVEVSQYRNTASVVRYFSNTFDHINDQKFESFRSEGTYSVAKVVQDLTDLYPTFYTVVYESVATVMVDRGWKSCDELFGLETKKVLLASCI